MVQLSASRFVCGGRDVCERLDGAVGEARQHIREVLADGDSKPTAALDNRDNRSDLRACFTAADVDPVFPVM